MAPAERPANPVLTAADVSDLTAAFVADPFMVRVKSDFHMFFEAWNLQRQRGQICYASSSCGSRWTYCRTVLAEPFHLSYPFVFKWSGAVYMIPEARQSGGVRLYRASPFPVVWKLVGNLLEGDYADPTLLRHCRTWWLFALSGSSTLTLHYAETLNGPWHEHPQSPLVVDDKGRSRPAGRIVTVRGRIFRWAQDCRQIYGHSVRAFEVETLSTRIYREREAVESPVLVPSGKDWNAAAMHHLDPHRLESRRWIACVDGASRDLAPSGRSGAVAA